MLQVDRRIKERAATCEAHFITYDNVQ